MFVYTLFLFVKSYGHSAQRYLISLCFDEKTLQTSMLLHNVVLITCLHFYNQGLLLVNYKMILPKKGARAQLLSPPYFALLRRFAKEKAFHSGESSSGQSEKHGYGTTVVVKGSIFLLSFSFLQRFQLHSRGRRDADHHIYNHGRSFVYYKGRASRY